MTLKGIAITGTRAAGKSTLAKALCERYDKFELANATTTRSRRNDDQANQYEYVSKGQFEKMMLTNEFEVTTQYQNEFYGISKRTLLQIAQREKVPIITIAPNLINQLKDSFMVVFLDAPDRVLDTRLKERAMKLTDEDSKQRQLDRQLWEVMRQSFPGLGPRNECEIDNETLERWSSPG